MSDDMPDWLAGLVSAPEDEEDDDQFLTAAQPQEDAVQPQVSTSQPQVAAFEGEDLMDDLRSQVVAEEPVPEPSVRRARSRYILGLLPWQILFLAVLMLLDVVVIGMLFLVMLGRVVLPF
jgi:hypothetical protein